LGVRREKFAEKGEHWTEDRVVIDFLVRLPVRLGVVGFNPFEKVDGFARPASNLSVFTWPLSLAGASWLLMPWIYSTCSNQTPPSK
jgi:hypothetical protein